MQTQRDRVNAYQFLMGRKSSALVLGDASRLEVPDRRFTFGVVFGIVLALLISIGCFLYGMFAPGSDTQWQLPGAIVIEEESGTSFVNQGGVLHPVRNYASALLVQGSEAHVETVSRDSLKGVQRGGPIGIIDAPESVPEPADMSTGPWLLCPPGTAKPDVSMQVRGEAKPLRADEIAIVADGNGQRYVLWQNRKHRVASQAVAVALGFSDSPPPVATDAWLDAVMDGPEIAPAVIAGEGAPGRDVGGEPHQVGDLFRQRATNGQERTYVLRDDGLAPINATELALLAATSGRTPVDISASEVLAVEKSSNTSLTDRLPELSDKRPADSGHVCLRQRAAGDHVTSEVVIGRESGSPMASTGAEMPPGGGMLVAQIPAPAEGKPTRYLIDDQGRKYLLANDETISALGLSGFPPTPVPESVLASLPSGPDLSRASVGAAQEG